jgi:hypothetical protein
VGAEEGGGEVRSEGVYCGGEHGVDCGVWMVKLEEKRRDEASHCLILCPWIFFF